MLSTTKHQHRRAIVCATMKVTALLLSSLIAGAVAAPAIVWKNGKDASESVVHTSEILPASSLFPNLPLEDSTVASVVFLLGRAEDGAENLSTLASSGALPGVASKYDAAHTIHHHVSGIESSYAMASLARENSNPHRVLEISLDEFNRKMASQVQESNQRSKALNQADILIVNCDADAFEVDSAVVKAIENDSVKMVTLASQRSVDEVKHERTIKSRVLMKTVNAPRRRLEDQDEQNDDAANANGGNDSMEGVYYVLVTPNIFAGILFLFFFSFIAWTGINCMGQITGQDVFVHKMPPIGREA